MPESRGVSRWSVDPLDAMAVSGWILTVAGVWLAVSLAVSLVVGGGLLLVFAMVDLALRVWKMRARTP